MRDREMVICDGSSAAEEFWRTLPETHEVLFVTENGFNATWAFFVRRREDQGELIGRLAQALMEQPITQTMAVEATDQDRVWHFERDADAQRRYTDNMRAAIEAAEARAKEK